jgi:hypothetical protein
MIIAFAQQMGNTEKEPRTSHGTIQEGFMKYDNSNSKRSGSNQKQTNK